MKRTLMTLAVALAGALASVAADIGGSTPRHWPPFVAADAETAGVVMMLPAICAALGFLGGLAWSPLGRKVIRFAVSRHQCWRMRRC